MTNVIVANVNIMDVIGHYVEAELSLNGWTGKVKQNLTGRIVYSEYNASLFFKPKGSRNKGYAIDENDIYSVKIIRKDNKENIYWMEAYSNKDQAEIKLKERLELEEKKREEQYKQRQERIELERKLEQEKIEKEIEKAKSLGGYEDLENDVISFYQSFEGEFFNEKFVKDTYIPILNKLIHKAIDNVGEYPKYYFDKKHNPKFTKLIETKLNIKLGNTQKGNIEKLNHYLAS